MAGAMDKGLMALMGIDDDMGQDEGLLNHNTTSSFFDNASDSDRDTHDDSHDNTTAQSATPPADARSTTASRHEREQQRALSQTAAPAPHRASTSSLFASSSAAKPRLSSAGSSSSPSSSSLFSPDYNPFSTGSPTKVRANKSPKKAARNSGASSMFSPTLSPRKPKRASSSASASKATSRSPSATQSSQSQSSSTSMDLRVASFSPPLKPRAQRGPEGLASPVSSFQLKKKAIAFSDSEDSDISPLEDNATLSLSSVSRRNVALNASFTSDAEMDMDMPLPPARSSHTNSASKAAMSGLLEELSDVEQEQGQGQRQRQQENQQGPVVDLDRDEDEHMLLSDSQAELAPSEPAKAKAPTKKQILEMQMEKERMWRNSDFTVQPRVNTKHTLSSLLQSAQSKLTQREDKASVDIPVAPKTPPKPNRPVTIALNDDSEDETQEDVERQKDEARWKLGVSRALLVAPISKEQRLEISRDLQVRTTIPMGKRLEVERALQMSPLSNKIQNMSLGLGSPSTASASLSQTSPQKSSALNNRRSSLKSPSKSQRPGTVSDIQQYNELMKRELAKRNLERRKQLEMEAKKSGTWKSPEEYAAEQLRSEDKRTKGLDPDEDEDADDEHDEDYDASKDPGQQDVAEDDEEAMELNSGDEDEVLSGESDVEEEGDNATKLDGQDLHSDDEHNESVGSEEDEEDEGDDDEEEEEDDNEDTVKMRRTQKKTNVIEDEDDVKVVIVDRSQAPTAPDSDDEAHESASESGSNSGNKNDSDDDVSDIEQDMEGESGTQGFGAFFESSYDPSAAKKDKFMALGRVNAPARGMASTHSPVIGTNPSQSPTQGDSQTGLSQSMAGALDFLSGNFPSATPQASSSSSAGDKLDSFSMPLSDEFGIDIPTMSPIVDEEDGFISSSLLGQVQSLDASMDPNSVLHSQKPRNAFDVLAGAMRQNPVDGAEASGGGLRRLQKRAAKPTRGGPISKNDKSAYIEYEAEEEEDEHMGMGGIDYESENDNDDYDLGDGMVDTNVVIDSKDAENVRQLHMKHEQVQHDKDISDLVQGIAAGGLWKRNKGQMDDLDLFDEEDMDGRFRRKKKLKVSEKIEKLADNPKTAAYARAFRKDKDDDQLVFLSDADESNDEADSSSKAKSLNRAGDDQEDDDMASLDSEDEVQPVHQVEESEEEEEEEMLNTDKRKEKLRQARLIRDADGGSVNGPMESGALTAMTKGQALPFYDSSNDGVVSERTVDHDSTVPGVRVKKTKEARKEPVEEYEDILRRKKVIQDIIDGVEDPVEQDVGQTSSQRRRTSSSFSAYRLMDRIVDRSQLAEADVGAGSGSTSAFGGTLGGRAGVDVDVEAIVRPRTLSRQNSSFMCEERKARFLSTVGEESRGANAGNRVVKEVNRRKMAFTTSSKQDGASTASSSKSISSTTTIRGVGSQPSDPSTATSQKSRTRAAGSSGPSRLLRILTVDEE
ncbi:hypothetical protein EC968_005928 [Mortierella alpina]|nr:hypothetical protein EC968_005928 [Mortierella alpina]